MTDTPETAPVAATRADRERLAAYYRHPLVANPSRAEAVLADDWLSGASYGEIAMLETLARHRLNATPSRQDGLREALEIIADLPTGQTEDVMSGHENAYRAIESRLAALSDTPPPDNEETEALRGENERLKAENERLTRAVGSGILNDLLTPDESDEFVKFIQFLRGQRDASAFNNGGK